ncbi:cytochrome P450 [Colletotrichum tofieldiae]|nr:cytochrome P450 [Colletotrichum tofieldiae]GKT78254.1 cytochrome P450 [Colletotrichum tofieldiae]
MASINSFDNFYLMNENVTTRRIYGLLTAILFVYLLYSLYRKALPKPIPGIPHNPKATQSILGDLPELAAVVSRTGDLSAWLHGRAEQYKSPVCQIFIQPLAPPCVILSDFREAQDICMRRKEFDRGQTMKNLFRGPSPNHHITLSTNDEWKAHRRLLQDLMSPPFLHNVAGPAIYANVLHLISLWRTKVHIADGRPFDAYQDIYYAALDAVIAFSFGKEFPHIAVKPVLDLICGLDTAQVNKLREKTTLDDPIEFPSVKCDKVIQATLDISINIERLQASPWPVWKWKIIEKLPPLNQTVRIRNKFVTEELKRALKRQQANGNDDSWMRSAVDLMVQREKKLAQDEKRVPEFFSPTMKEELFGVITGGHDTTSTTILWGLKLLADHPSAQSELRTAMGSAYFNASNEARNPSIEEIMHIKVPYLDAAMEEILRCAGTAPLVEREALCDTILLGHSIPKGTKIFCLGQGAGIRKPAYKVDELRRSETCRSAVKNRGKVSEWDPEDVAAFKPKRWLVPSRSSGKTQINGETANMNRDEEFDSTAGPQIAFGLGRRSCFGKRLAYVELRILLSLIVWNFEILKCPEALSGYEGKDGVTHKPIKNYVRLREVRR